jgi:WD40 repeat protein
MRTEAAVALLRRTRLFAELREDTLRALADRSVERSYPRHGRLFTRATRQRPVRAGQRPGQGQLQPGRPECGRHQRRRPGQQLGRRRLVGRPLAGHTDLALGVVFVDGGNTLVTSGWDGSLIFWDLRPTSWEAKACQLAGRNLTHDEWDQFVGGDYRRTCPRWPDGG